MFTYIQVLNDFYKEKKSLDAVQRALSAKSFRQNGAKMIMDIVDDVLSLLPVDYNMVPWVTRRCLCVCVCVCVCACVFMHA